MVEQLASLLLPIDALVVHQDFKPWENATSQVVSLFRNLWFLCVLFNLTTMEDNEATALDWLKHALTRIATKTPPMVVEEFNDGFASEIEYNTVIRQEYADSVSPVCFHDQLLIKQFQVVFKQRVRLTKYLSLRSSDLRTISTGQIIFLLAMHDIETMRALEGFPSSLVTYFINDSLNKNHVLSTCMEGIADQVSRKLCPHHIVTDRFAGDKRLPNSLDSQSFSTSSSKATLTRTPQASDQQYS
jgi:phosphatidylinositol 4-kinase